MSALDGQVSLVTGSSRGIGAVIAADLTADQRTGTCVRYLATKDRYLRYDQALAAGWPIATGVIEGERA
jgi:NAD(P)-dependent dehydrogenase (short-subunit alcohol dehydrogenase family)